MGPNIYPGLLLIAGNRLFFPAVKRKVTGYYIFEKKKTNKGKTGTNERKENRFLEMQTKIACFISLLDCFRSTAQQRTLPTDRQERFY